MKLKTTDPQEILDISTEFFATQPRAFENGYCRYITATGRRCVAGNLIEIQTAADERELRTTSGGIPTVIREMIGHDFYIQHQDAVTLLADLQKLHDGTRYWEHEGNGSFRGWDSLYEVSAKHGLTFTQPADTIQS